MVFRVNKTKDYTVLSNHHLRDSRLSLKAKGLLSVMLSLPDDWDYSIQGLVAINMESETAIKTTLKELQNCGYLAIKKLLPNQTKSGRIEYEYSVFEYPQEVVKQEVEVQPVEVQKVEVQEVEVQPLEVLAVGNQVQLSTEELSTKELSTDNIYVANATQSPRSEPKKPKTTTKPPKVKFVKPTLEEVQAYCLERNNGIDPQQWIDYYEANGWKVGKNPMRDWKASIRTWERNGYNQPTQVQAQPVTQSYQSTNSSGWWGE